MSITNDILAKLAPAFEGPFTTRRTTHVSLLPSSAEAVLAWTLATRQSQTVVLVTEGPHALETRHQDLRTLMPETPPGDAPSPELLYFPAREALAEKDSDPDVVGSRLQALGHLERGPASSPVIVATCIQAMMQRTLPPSTLADETLAIAREDELELEPVVERLTACGYAAVPQVQEKGELAVKGGLLDIWPPTGNWPLRIDFFGSTIESIRTFDPVSQRSLERPQRVLLPPPTESTPRARGRADFAAYLPPGAVILWSDMDGIREHSAAFEARMADAGQQRYITPLRKLISEIGDCDDVREIVTATAPPAREAVDIDIAPVVHPVELPRETLEPDTAAKVRREIFDIYRGRAQAGHAVCAFFDTTGALDHFRAEVGDAGLALAVGVLSDGFASTSSGITVLSERDVFGQKKLRAQRYDPLGNVPRPSRDTGARIADLAGLEPGDLVIHVEHGLGRYLGLNEIVFDGRRQEVISIEYADQAKLHVPVTHAHLLSRYVGASRERATLHRLGGKRWNRDKAAAQEAIADLASGLLETQAHRSLLEGHTFPGDTSWQNEFEASFPYQETPDQHRVIASVKQDMQSPQPMDRLVCGDAGYGKTEVAMRAAFKTVMAQKQVAVLVPTTVLAQQHYGTFGERMAPYPFRIEMLSRFRSRGQQEAILRGLADGTVDIVIGTHALVQPHVRFKDLGLAVIDEEQRFGVKHKERLKQMRRLVDVLTLTATPIPRTLYMSLTGARDMSLLQTPPRERMAIDTIVARDNDELVREAILREMNREGQVFYLYNRVMTIERAARRLARVVPEARVAIAHGQMSSGHLRTIMRAFVDGEFDVLLCTTIIESGMDIPRANTILIDRADRFGIADLYQLRGRVGRSSHKAYAYLLLPAHGHVDADARKRIGAIKRYSALGAGFSLAMRDLEIRGAGNLLGAAQSGHITAIGFALYCQLLERTVARMKGQPIPPLVDVDAQIDFVDLSPANPENPAGACLPYAYVDDEPLRMDVYRKLARTGTTEELQALRGELQDRFGPLPMPTENLLAVAGIRLAAHAKRIERIRVRGSTVILTRDDGHYFMRGKRYPRLEHTTVPERLTELHELISTCDTWAEVPHNRSGL